ncbi:MAG: hypothetical protein HKN47_21150 [Pirellulaceae bacterium]|nr:hypothetical protein [Pirellulaceae bacterium]
MSACLAVIVALAGKHRVDSPWLPVFAMITDADTWEMTASRTSIVAVKPC